MSTRQDLQEIRSFTQSPAMGSDRSFGFVIATAFLVIALLPLTGEGEIRYWALAVAATLAAAATVRPVLLRSANRVWFRFGLLLHQVMSPVIMGVMFFLVVMPVGLLMRAARQGLRLERDPAAKSYWIDRDPVGPTAESMKNQF